MYWNVALSVWYFLIKLQLNEFNRVSHVNYSLWVLSPEFPLLWLLSRCNVQQFFRFFWCQRIWQCSGLSTNKSRYQILEMCTKKNRIEYKLGIKNYGQVGVVRTKYQEVFRLQATVALCNEYNITLQPTTMFISCIYMHKEPGNVFRMIHAID